MNKRFIILVAEDDLTDIEFMKRSIPRRNGFPVDLHIARDGADAIGYLLGEGEFADRKQHPFPDLLVLDLKMPRMDGLDVLRWLHEQKECSRLPKIMLSGSSLDEDVEEAYELGVNTFFLKPNSLKELQELMRRVVKYWAVSRRPHLKHFC